MYTLTRAQPVTRWLSSAHAVPTTRLTSAHDRYLHFCISASSTEKAKETRGTGPHWAERAEPFPTAGLPRAVPRAVVPRLLLLLTVPSAFVWISPGRRSFYFFSRPPPASTIVPALSQPFHLLPRRGRKEEGHCTFFQLHTGIWKFIRSQLDPVALAGPIFTFPLDLGFPHLHQQILCCWEEFQYWYGFIGDFCPPCRVPPVTQPC